MELKLFTPLMTLEQEMQSIFDRAFGRPADLMLRPSMDVTQGEGRMDVELELPGLEAEDVDISVEDDVLVVSGEKRRSRQIEKEHCFVSERTFGSFERRIMLPDGFDVEGITAAFEAGVLKITVPMEERVETPAHHISVTTR